MEGPPVRLFIGTAVPIYQGDLIQHAASHELEAPQWRVASRDQWHVTALFLGERDERNMATYLSKVAGVAARTAPIELLKGSLATMPKAAPTMLWVRFQPNPALTRLHRELAAEFGVEPSHYVPYWPHITLARSRGRITAPIDRPPLVKELMLSELTLFRSERSDHGSVHTAMGSWPLSGTGPIGPVAVG